VSGDPDMDAASRLRARLRTLDEQRAEVIAALEALEARRMNEARKADRVPLFPEAPVTATSSTGDKIALFRRLFAGREDVFPLRWDNRKTGRGGYAPACCNEWKRGLCGKPQIKCSECAHQAFLPVTDDVIDRHLRGGASSRSDAADYVAGVYPLLADESCRFLAADFDKASWAEDALAMMETCRLRGVPAALERSRSGNGGHVWIFFADAVAARTARALGASLLTETMERRPEIGFGSYDRFFPSQDTMPLGGFGNLIALPLQGRARRRGNSLFVDARLRPYDDQWAFLSSLPLMDAHDASRMVADAEKRGRVLGVRMPVEDEHAAEPWKMTPSRRPSPAPATEPVPERLDIVLGDQVYIDRTGLPAWLAAQIIRLAAFQNPEFYKAQAMRLPTFGKPRIVSCAELHQKHIGLPRGCLDELVALLSVHGSAVAIDDQRMAGTALPDGVSFQGDLEEPQIRAAKALGAHDDGVLAATTAFGKTVVAAHLIAKRRVNALVLVHRKELVKQWVERLRTFLDIDPKLIGTIGGGKRKPTGVIDVALIQSLVRRGEVADLVGDYGHLIVDECHHLSAASFELVARRAKARFILGLSATVARKDGHQPIIFMQCGPIRHRVDARTQAARRGIAHRVRPRRTTFQLPQPLAIMERPPMPAVYAAIADDEARNDMIFDDVLRALDAKRSPVILTERRDHLEYLQGRLSRFVRNLAVLRGGMSAAERKASEDALQVPHGEERLILATGRYIGEGFDDDRLDTLFLTMPISWKGTLAQYVGRLHRRHAGKTDVLVYDYVDDAVPLLSRMAGKRQIGYRALGYSIE
jgi:superfamily II DNA or RNA helicase